MSDQVETLRAFLLADPAVAGLIGERMYPVVLPQAPTLPAVTFQRISSQREHDTQGAAGLARPRIQIDSWAATFEGARAVADAIRSRLDGYRGGAIRGAFFENEADLYEDGAQHRRVSQDYFIWFGE